MSSELEQERELGEIMRRFEGTVLPQLQNARASMAIYSGVCDARLALEVGASILLNKPLFGRCRQGCAHSDETVGGR